MSTSNIESFHGRHNIIGMLMMIGAMSVVPMVDVIAKTLVVADIPALQVVYLRMMCGTIILLPFMLSTHRQELVPAQGWSNAFLLGFFNFSTGACFFGALRYLAIADTAAISFVQPLFVTVLSRVFLSERVDLPRWLALLVGFSATLLIIRPSLDTINPGTILALGSGLSMACYVIFVKHGTRRSIRVSVVAMTYQTHFTACLIATPLMFSLWHHLSHEQWMMAIGLTSVGLVGQYLIINAYRYGEASFVAPLAYTEIITSTIASWYFFNQVPDIITFIGVAILIGSSILLARQHQTKLRK